MGRRVKHANSKRRNTVKRRNTMKRRNTVKRRNTMKRRNRKNKTKQRYFKNIQKGGWKKDDMITLDEDIYQAQLDRFGLLGEDALSRGKSLMEPPFYNDMIKKDKKTNLQIPRKYEIVFAALIWQMERLKYGESGTEQQRKTRAVAHRNEIAQLIIGAAGIAA